MLPSTEALMQAAAELWVRCAAEAIGASGRFAVALSGGSTPKRLYALLATPALGARVEWGRVHVLFGDERCVPPESTESNYRMAREALLEHVPIPAANVHRMRGERDPPEAAAVYEEELRALLGTPVGPPAAAAGRRLDLVLLGLGADGHTASLFPGTDALRETTRWVVAHAVAAAGMWRLTMTPPLFDAAREVCFLVSGEDKAKILARVLEGPHGADELPAQYVAARAASPRWLVDAAAASALRAG